MFHDRYQQEQGSVRTVVTGQEGRMAFPPFDQMAATFLAGLVEEAGIPQGPVMYRRAPADLQGRAYVLLERTNLRAMVDQMATQGQPPFDVWFPPPNNGDERTLQMYRTLMLGEAGRSRPQPRTRDGSSSGTRFGHLPASAPNPVARGFSSGGAASRTVSSTLSMRCRSMSTTSNLNRSNPKVSPVAGMRPR